MENEKVIQRYKDGDRLNHWLVAIAFFLAALSGLALFHPALFWFSDLFGGGPWTRILHPFLGVLMFAGFLRLMMKLWCHNRMGENDKQWLRQWRDVLGNHEERLPEVGRYNAGQKLIFWLMVISLIVLLVTGIVFWRPWFAGYFPLWLVRSAALLHAIAATVLVLGVIVHIYAAIWVKGSMRAMMRGTVSVNWACKHHPGWFRQVSKE